MNDINVPPNFSDGVYSNFYLAQTGSSFNDNVSLKNDSAIITELKGLKDRLQKINQLCMISKEKKIAKLNFYKQELSDTNTQILLQSQKNKEFEVFREKSLKNLSDKLYYLKSKNSSILAQIQSSQQKISKFEKENFELSVKNQELINKKKSLEDSVHKIEENNKITNLRLFDLTDKENTYKIIKESYEEALFNYQQKRALAYQDIKKLNNRLQELKGNIRVFCKIRPLLAEDRSDPLKFEINDRTITIYKSEKPSKFIFDRIFGPSASIDEVFEEISQLVQSALDGYKVCVFAYGQTGSGKTYTMEGQSCNKINENKGIIQKSVELMFAASKKLEEIGWSYSFYASSIEIYNEQVRDLLDGSKILTGISSSMPNAVSIQISNYEDIIPLLIKSRNQRAEAETHSNIHSSRSHSLFQLKICGVKDNETNNGVLNLIDLAGSERLKISKDEGDRKKEYKAINKSLSHLGDVIHALAKKDKYVPYRNSKLTYILQSCLGGDGKTLMFVNISPLAVNIKETLSSLVFAHKVNACTLN